MVRRKTIPLMVEDLAISEGIMLHCSRASDSYQAGERSMARSDACTCSTDRTQTGSASIIEPTAQPLVQW